MVESSCVSQERFEMMMGSMDGVLLWPISGTYLRFSLVLLIEDLSLAGAATMYEAILVEKW